MDTKTTRMIALGAAYAINCLPCLEYHRKGAIEAGLTTEQMRAAIRVAEGVRNGARSKTKAFAEELFGEIRIHRARAKLKKALQGRCDFARDERGVLVCEPQE